MTGFSPAANRLFSQLEPSDQIIVLDLLAAIWRIPRGQAARRRPSTARLITTLAQRRALIEQRRRLRDLRKLYEDAGRTRAEASQ